MIHNLIFHTAAGILNFQNELFILFKSTNIYPAICGFLLDSMDAGILYKGNQCQFWNQIFSCLIFHINFKVESITKTILLQIQISIDELHLFFYRDIVRYPVHILTFQDSQPLYHMGCFCFLLQKAVHSDTLQNIEKKMRINLTLQRQQFSILPFDVHFLFLQTVCIHRSNQFVDTSCHIVIVFHQRTDLILTLNFTDFMQAIRIGLIKRKTQGF